MKYVFITISAIAALFLQFSIAPVISYAGIGPDFIIIFLIGIFKYCGSSTVVMLASLLGAFYDVTCNGNIFINTVSYLVIAVGLVLLKLLFDKQEFGIGLIGLTVAVLIKGVITTLGLYVIELTKGVDFIYFFKAIPAVAYCVVLYIPTYFLFKWLFSIKLGQPRSNILPN